MFSKNRCNIRISTVLTVAATIVFGLLMFIPVANAEQPYDITVCGSGTVTMLSQSKELTVRSLDFKGIIRSNHENKVFDNCTLHHVRVVRVVAGKVTAHGYSKFMDPTGDIVVLDFSQVGKEITTKFLHGTGKWKAITGSGKVRPIARGKPITAGTVQGCNRQTGTFELPK